MCSAFMIRVRMLSYLREVQKITPKSSIGPFLKSASACLQQTKAVFSVLKAYRGHCTSYIRHSSEPSLMVMASL